MESGFFRDIACSRKFLQSQRCSSSLQGHSDRALSHLCKKHDMLQQTWIIMSRLNRYSQCCERTCGFPHISKGFDGPFSLMHEQEAGREQ